MTTPNIVGTLVAIPIKGRKLLNRTGGKQSPYVQLKLGEQKKRTKASLIASADPEWDHEASFFYPPRYSVFSCLDPNLLAPTNSIALSFFFSLVVLSCAAAPVLLLLCC